ncbi:MAG: beta-ketoacyl synthase N-terminal-like domain-containing protein [Verrucomicrobiota bacterium]|nr:beta-ketoacyl synthase N-terminal-like domain-containing protein [Verrucomicrobiota bacterium]
MNPVVITNAEIITPYGLGTELCWQGLLRGESALAETDRFDTAEFNSKWAGIVPGLSYHEGKSLVFQMLEKVFGNHSIPADAKLMLATLNGEMDCVEESVLHGRGEPHACCMTELLRSAQKLCGVADEGSVVSSACASSTVALGLAASAIRNGEYDCAVVVSCDGVTEFLYSGFSSLMALDSNAACPFDAKHDGLTIGEAAGYMVLMSEERARKEDRPNLGELAGWGMSNDANHMTGPLRDGSGLARSVEIALKVAGIGEGQIDFIAAHGTGTVYNDEMEMAAFHSVFSSPRPTYSVKGGMGHTMGAAGLVEAVLALKTFETDWVPPTVALQSPAKEAGGWVRGEAVELAAEYALSTNAGFGGVNASLVLKKGGAQ